MPATPLPARSCCCSFSLCCRPPWGRRMPLCAPSPALVRRQRRCWPRRWRTGLVPARPCRPCAARVRRRWRGSRRRFRDPQLAVASAWDRAEDAVAAQRGSHGCGLYWYTDLPSAEAAAHASHRPILELRLLGKLTDEYSCANSRFFRVVLYRDPVLSAWLRERVVLFWSSERPVPQVSIDFGDGRVLRTTVGGNSVHLLLIEVGWPIDALPGLWGPQPFLRRLQAAEATWSAMQHASDPWAVLFHALPRRGPRGRARARPPGLSLAGPALAASRTGLTRRSQPLTRRSRRRSVPSANPSSRRRC